MITLNVREESKIGVFRAFRYMYEEIELDEWCDELQISRSQLYRFENRKQEIPVKVAWAMAELMEKKFFDIVDKDGLMVQTY